MRIKRCDGHMKSLKLSILGLAPASILFFFLGLLFVNEDIDNTPRKRRAFTELTGLCKPEDRK
jgi:hypothetical protein